jgi:PAS domain S-box-containing protein
MQPSDVAESRYLDLIDQMILILDSRLRVRFANRVLCDMLCCKREQVLNQPWFETFIPETEGETQRSEFENQVHCGTDLEFWYSESPVVCGTGLEAMVAWHNVPVKDTDGAVEFIFCTGEDITERKRAEENLRHNEDRFLSFVQKNNGIIIQFDSGRNPLFFHGAVDQITGYDGSQLLEGRPVWTDIVHPEDLESFREVLDTVCMIPNHSLEQEYRIVRRDGQVRWIRELVQNVSDDGGKAILLQAAIYDITDRKQVEEEKKELERKLIQSQKMEAVGRLAGGISHDFNNILTAIIGYVDLLMMQQDLHDNHLRYLSEIRKSGERAASLTQQLLAYSRKQVLQPKIINLNQLITELNRLLGRLIGENIRLVNDLDPLLGDIKADPGQMQQVIMNLAVNARDAMPDGGELVIATRNVFLDSEYCRRNPEARQGSYVRMSIRDSGTGMDEETSKHIFEPFFTTKEVGKGTGLGLATVYGIVKQSGGSITFTSEPGRGTEFRMYLPRHKEQKSANRENLRQGETCGGSERVLLVEDEEDVRSMIALSLCHYGYSVVEAGTGDRALELFEQSDGKIDLVITDIIMPGMNGPQLARRLLQGRPDLRVLYITGYADNPHLKHDLAERRFPLLQKPFSPETLAAAVRRLLDN